MDAPAPDAGTGADSSTQADGGADAGIPAMCRVTTDRVPPFEVTFKLVNRGARPVFLRRGCLNIEFVVSSCASRYTDVVGQTAACGCNCADASCTGGVACGPCPQDMGVAVAAGQTHDVKWQAVDVTVESRVTFQCIRRTPLPAAIYSVTFPLFEDEASAAMNRGPVRRASRTFPLPADGGGVVELDIGAPAGPGNPDAGPPAACQPPPGQAGAVCAPPFSPAVGCDLDGEYTYGPDGGLVAWVERSALTPPAGYSRTRTYQRDPRPPISCRNEIPRCGASHDRFTTADIVQAMSAPDVTAAFAQTPGLVFGHDSRPYDGQVLLVRRKDGRELRIGQPCDAVRRCDRPLTAGLERLAAVLQRLDRQQLDTAGCEALRTP